MQNLKPCPYRHVADEGHILCDKIKTGDKQVSPNICRNCPISAINCSHLRATLDHSSRLPITVRYGNGKTEVWADVGGPAIKIERAACAEKVVPISSPRDCAGCVFRKPVEQSNSGTVNSVMVNGRTTVEKKQSPASRPVRRAPVPEPVAPQPIVMQASQPQPEPVDEKRESIVAQKIIKLQDWLAQQSKPKKEDADGKAEPRTIAVGEPRVMRKSVEEKRVGWTD